MKSFRFSFPVMVLALITAPERERHNCWALRSSPSARPANTPALPCSWCTLPSAEPAGSDCSAVRNAKSSSGSLRRLSLSPVGPAAASRTPHKHRCGTARTPASGRTAAAKTLRCGRLSQSPSSDGHRFPALPPSRSANPAAWSHAAPADKSTLQHKQSPPPTAAAGRARQPPFLPHRLTASGVIPILRAMAFWQTPSPCHVRARSPPAALGQV